MLFLFIGVNQFYQWVDQLILIYLIIRYCLFQKQQYFQNIKHKQMSTDTMPNGQAHSNNNNQISNQDNNPMMKLLHQYYDKVTSQQTLYKQKLVEIKQTISNIFTQNLNKQFTLFEQQFHKVKYIFTTEIKTLLYYLQNFLDKHSLDPKSNNLYPLFNSIDHSIQQNLTFLKQQFTIKFNYPLEKSHIHQQINKIKYQIIQKQLGEIQYLLNHNQNFNKYCQPEIKKIQQIHHTYLNLYQLAQKQLYTPQIIFTGNIDQCIILLSLNPKIQKLTLGLRSDTGKITIQQYRQIYHKLQSSKHLLTNLTLKIMDMEFEQIKCNQMKGFIKQLKHLKKLKVQNYYGENKLGMFQDYNWLPLKKQTHIIGKVW